MTDGTTLDWGNLLGAIAIVMGVSLLGFFLLIGFAVRQVRKANIPKNADFTETLQRVPFSIVLAMDLLDLGLDVLAAPFSWIILDRLGLKALRGFTVVEALLPFTQPIPTLTIAWILVRFFNVRF